MCDYRESRENWEWSNLAPYASHSSDPSLSWRRSENDAHVANPLSPRQRQADVHFPGAQIGHFQTRDLAGSQSRFKTAFQIDKERIASSTAFRRLEYKTQIFLSHEGDHFRTRLTHTIEVDETARFIAQALRLNEDLVNAIALGHDLGHTPFGHAGETMLNELFRRYWPESAKEEIVSGQKYGPAFYHNVQSVRVVDSLEKGYEWDRRPKVDQPNLHNPPIGQGWGLDLTWAVREGILKHSSRGLRANQLRMYGSDYLMDELDPFQPATLEGQVVEFADEIASMIHDLEDGLRSRILKLNDMRNALREWITPENLSDLLGLTPRFGHRSPIDVRIQSRVGKLLALLDEIRQGDCTMGVILAFLRSVLVSNLAETSYWRLRCCMAGQNPSLVDLRHPDAQEANPEDLVWIHFNLKAAPGPTDNSYCPMAWDIDPLYREASVRTYHRVEGRVQPASDRVLENIQIGWVLRTTDPGESRYVILERENGQVWAYPLDNVCITFGGAKLIGYDHKLLGLREWLRREFISQHLHNASIVLRMENKGESFLTALFERYFSTPKIMHRSALVRFNMWDMALSSPDTLKKRRAFVLRIVEHLQGMTDRYLTEEYTRLFLPGTRVDERDEMTMVDTE
jgi:dGTP triphosphohydrolase